MAKIRSISLEEKEQKREHIKKSALKLYSQMRSFPSVDKIAKESGVAKGTIYLYYKTKEEIFLAILADGYELFFKKIEAKLKSETSFELDQLIHLMIELLSQDPLFMDLAVLGPTFLEQNVSLEKLTLFKDDLNKNIESMARALESSLGIDKEVLKNLLITTFALLIGLWQTSRPIGNLKKLANKKEYSYLFPDFKTQAPKAILALWRGYFL